MNDAAVERDQAEEASLSHELSDEALEAVAEEARANPRLLLSGYACPW